MERSCACGSARGKVLEDDRDVPQAVGLRKADISLLTDTVAQASSEPVWGIRQKRTMAIERLGTVADLFLQCACTLIKSIRLPLMPHG